MLEKEEETQNRTAASDRSSVRHLLLAVIAAVGMLVAWQLTSVIVPAFGVVLLAILLRGLARVVSRWTPIPETWAVGPVVVALLASLGAVGRWLIGQSVTMVFGADAGAVRVGTLCGRPLCGRKCGDAAGSGGGC